MKNQLVINTLSFEVHTEVYDGYGDMEMTDCRFTIDRKSYVLTMTDFQTGDVEQPVTLEGGQMAKLLRYIVHTLEIFMWEQDYSLRPDGGIMTRFLMGKKIFHGRFEEWIGSTAHKGTGGKSVMAGAGGIHKPHRADICSYENYLPDRPEELYLSLSEYFEPENEVF